MTLTVMAAAGWLFLVLAIRPLTGALAFGIAFALFAHVSGYWSAFRAVRRRQDGNGKREDDAYDWGTTAILLTTASLVSWGLLAWLDASFDLAILVFSVSLGAGQVLALVYLYELAP